MNEKMTPQTTLERIVTAKTNVISDRDLNVPSAPVPMPSGIRHDARNEAWNGELDIAHQTRAAAVTIDAGKTVAAARWLLARWGGSPMRVAHDNFRTT